MTKQTQINAEKGQHTIVIERRFDALPELVFSLFQDPALYTQWAKPNNTVFELEKLDCRTGGSFLYHHTHENGMKFSFYGIFHEVESPKFIVRTSEFRGLPQKLLPVLENYRFEPLNGGQTLLTIIIICPDEAYRDGMFNAGMQAHFDHSFALLDHMISNPF
ncbi:MAG TPA: SRPBCC domain-containing protein [Saprospiraceae bacterium]|nr:SRPBCC domain-containing protein [Saprospiraceae bacterium]HMQ84859.1 SRPBCC domain-containing protein [Saprospiraceae bacterium]